MNKRMVTKHLHRHMADRQMLWMGGRGKYSWLLLLGLLVLLWWRSNGG